MPIAVNSCFCGTLVCLCGFGSFNDPRPYLDDFQLVAEVGRAAAHDIKGPATAAVHTAARAGRAGRVAAKRTKWLWAPVGWLLRGGKSGEATEPGSVRLAAESVAVAVQPLLSSQHHHTSSRSATPSPGDSPVTTSQQGQGQGYEGPGVVGERQHEWQEDSKKEAAARSWPSGPQ